MSEVVIGAPYAVAESLMNHFNVSNNFHSISIEIKYDFVCINICWVAREVLKPEPVSQHLLRGPASISA